MTESEIKALSDAELDKVVHTVVMKKEPNTKWLASYDGGKSSCDSTNPINGPWYTEQQLRQWLENRHADNTHQDYEIVAIERVPKYTSSWASCGEVIDRMRQLGHMRHVASKSNSLVQFSREYVGNVTVLGSSWGRSELRATVEAAVMAVMGEKR